MAQQLHQDKPQLLVMLDARKQVSGLMLAWLLFRCCFSSSGAASKCAAGVVCYVTVL
jgi:hypothetical protein